MQPHGALTAVRLKAEGQSFKVDYREDYTTLQKSHLCEFKTLK